MALALQYIHHFGVDRKDEAHAELHHGGCSAKSRHRLCTIMAADRFGVTDWTTLEENEGEEETGVLVLGQFSLSFFYSLFFVPLGRLCR